MLMQWLLAALILGQVVLVCARQTDTSGGLRDTAVKEFAARPAGRPVTGSTTVTATTPVAKRPSTRRKCRVSISGTVPFIVRPQG
jgi:hypothetical protein